MRRYRYKAKNRNGEVVAGEVEASSALLAAKLVRQKGLVVFSLIPLSQNPLDVIAKLRDRITFGDLTVFTRQLATMINAGLPLTEALLILRSQSKVSLQKVVGQVLADVEGGLALSSAMAKHPKIFTASYVALVRSGELGGLLDEVLVLHEVGHEGLEVVHGEGGVRMAGDLAAVLGMFIVG